VVCAGVRLEPKVVGSTNPGIVSDLAQPPNSATATINTAKSSSTLCILSILRLKHMSYAKTSFVAGESVFTDGSLLLKMNHAGLSFGSRGSNNSPMV